MMNNDGCGVASGENHDDNNNNDGCDSQDDNDKWSW